MKSPVSNPAKRTQKRAAMGVTLVELLVTIAVLAILLGIGVPSFSRIMATNRMATQTNEFLAGLKLARSEAIRRGQNIAIRASTIGLPANFATGWNIFTDDNGNGAAGSSETDGTNIRVNGALAANTTVTRVSSALGAYSAADRGYVVFTGRGASANGAAFFRICDANDSTIPGRVIQVSVVGNVTLDSTTATCP